MRDSTRVAGIFYAYDFIEVRKKVVGTGITYLNLIIFASIASFEVFTKAA